MMKGNEYQLKQLKPETRSLKNKNVIFRKKNNLTELNFCRQILEGTLRTNYKIHTEMQRTTNNQDSLSRVRLSIQGWRQNGHISVRVKRTTAQEGSLLAPKWNKEDTHVRQWSVMGCQNSRKVIQHGMKESKKVEESAFVE